ncbi:predicted protein [Uncinocarpus reesii 1704]|uniref:Uncharacterized protein n=1 Tax=Uncinocarpus reesii (strain UAMH 1704) TaxID=336963 RepID=C4JR01_UNCRE|nr:uncharacterized protein UREG_03483 [Uncinocarpus reesii 1704]EEP78637.1 predicted protein [Uncinocarpus reesii 1704]
MASELVNLSKTAINSGDFSVLQGQTFSAALNTSADAHAGLRLILTRLLLDISQSYRAFSDRVATLQKEQKNKEALQQMIRAASVEFQKNAERLIDLAGYEAKMIVSHLPANAQASSQKYFDAGLARATVYLSKIWTERVNAVFAALPKLLEGDLSVLTVSFDYVVRETDAAVFAN